MSKSDWSSLSGGIVDTNVRGGPTAGVTPPNGGGSHVYGMRMVDGTAGVAGLYCVINGFSPIASPALGGRVSGALRRNSLGATTGFAPFLFFAATGTTVAANAYILGLSDESASHIQLRKGPLAGGLAAVSAIAPATAPNVLMQSTNTFAPDQWLHLRLDVIVQGTGDVILQVYRNDLAAYSVASPVWTAVPGMEGAFTAFAGFVDDALGTNSGSDPLIGGYCGFAARFEATNRVCYFDQLSLDRQLA